MKVNLKSILALVLLIMAHTAAAAQEPAASETVDHLRLQLIELQSKEELLRLRAQQLDEDLKPENIEHALAGIGSTRPEDLREARRRQLTFERESVKAQLKIVELTRTRLETAIANAEARAYQESALPQPSPPQQALRLSSITFSLAGIGMFVSFLISLAILLLLVKASEKTTV